MFGEIETGDLDFFADAQAEDSLHNVSDDCRADDCQHERDANGFQLLNPEGLADDVFEVSVQVWVDGWRGKNAGEKSSQRPADRVNSERVERVIITQPALQFVAGEERNESSGDSNDHRAGGINKAASGCDHDQ